MKNNRSTHLDHDFFKKHQLSTEAPAPDALFWKLWQACEAIAKQALNTKFIQGIKSGTLNPVTYGAFNINDAYYCFKGAEDYQKAAEKATNPVLKAFLLKKHQSYQKYNESFPKTWYIKDAEGIEPSEICKQYSEFESSVASQKDPIYTLICMLPCEYLWAWLGTQLSPPVLGNLYANWITANNCASGAYAMGNFLYEYQKVNPIDESLALQLYIQAMKYECGNFEGAIK